MPIRLHIVSGSFLPTMSELSRRNRDCMVGKVKNLLSGLLQRETTNYIKMFNSLFSLK